MPITRANRRRGAQRAPEPYQPPLRRNSALSSDPSVSDEDSPATPVSPIARRELDRLTPQTPAPEPGPDQPGIALPFPFTLPNNAAQVAPAPAPQPLANVAQAHVHDVSPTQLLPPVQNANDRTPAVPNAQPTQPNYAGVSFLDNSDIQAVIGRQIGAFVTLFLLLVHKSDTIRIQTLTGRSFDSVRLILRDLHNNFIVVLIAPHLTTVLQTGARILLVDYVIKAQNGNPADKYLVSSRQSKLYNVPSIAHEDIIFPALQIQAISVPDLIIANHIPLSVPLLVPCKLSINSFLRLISWKCPCGKLSDFQTGSTVLCQPDSSNRRPGMTHQAHECKMEFCLNATLTDPLNPLGPQRNVVLYDQCLRELLGTDVVTHSLSTRDSADPHHDDGVLLNSKLPGYRTGVPCTLTIYIHKSGNASTIHVLKITNH